MGLGRIGRQVIQLPLVIERAGSVDVAAGAVGGVLPHAGLGPGGRVVEAADQLPQVVGAAGRGTVSDSQHNALEVRGRVCGNPDTQRCGWLDGLLEPPAKPRGAAVALEHVVAGHQVDSAVLVGRAAVDDGHQVAAWQGVHLGE